MPETLRKSAEGAAGFVRPTSAPSAASAPSAPSRRLFWSLGPLVLLALLVFALLKVGPLGVFRAAFPPIEELTIERVTLPKPGEMVVHVVNGGPQPVTVGRGRAACRSSRDEYGPHLRLHDPGCDANAECRCAIPHDVRAPRYLRRCHSGLSRAALVSRSAQRQSPLAR